MAVTQNTYTGDGSTVLFSFTFPYLETTDIKVSLDGSDTTAYTLANATTVQFNTAPGSGVAIRIYRKTDDTGLPATFYSGSAIRASDLNENFTQNLYLTQETVRDALNSNDTAAAAVATANIALSTAQNAESTSNTAISTANTALSTANTASTNASAAVVTANTADTNATAAVNTANTAASDASTALTTANTADTNATNALSTANTALSNSTTAISTANSAESNATAAVSTANNALTVANNAVNTADGAVTTANTATATASDAITLASQAISLGQKAFRDLYNAVAGVAGSKIIDLGDLASGCASDYFTGENGGTANYNCAIGCGVTDLGTL